MSSSELLIYFLRYCRERSPSNEANHF